MWEDTKLGLSELRSREKIAVSSDKEWVHHTVKAFDWMKPGKVRVFDPDDFGDAKEWAAN